MKKYIFDYTLNYTEKETGRNFEALNPYTKIIEAEDDQKAVDNFKAAMLNSGHDGFAMQIRILGILEVSQ